MRLLFFIAIVAVVFVVAVVVRIQPPCIAILVHKLAWRTNKAKLSFFCYVAPRYFSV